MKLKGGWRLVEMVERWFQASEFAELRDRRLASAQRAIPRKEITLMSRHRIAEKPKEIVVGWDPPLQTFFLQIFDPAMDEEIEFGINCEVHFCSSILLAPEFKAILLNAGLRK
jgi:hypothetical protein